MLTRPRGEDEPEAPVLWIHPSRGLRFIDVASLWECRELLFYFAWRDVKVRYKQSVLGIAWILIQPVAQMIIFATIFGRLIGLPSEGVPYAVFVFSGLAAWTYFSSTISKMATSLDGNMHLITKIYFPRVILPTSVMLGTLVDFGIVLPIVLISCVLVKGVPLGNWLFIVPGVAMLLAVTFGIGLWMAALNARYRDVILALPVILQVGIYLTPVIYSASIVSKVVSDDWLPVLAFANPMIGVVEVFRWATLATDAPQPLAVVMSLLSTVVLVATGGLYFAKTERTVVDRI